MNQDGPTENHWTDTFSENEHSRAFPFITQCHRELQSRYCDDANRDMPSRFLCYLLNEIRTNTLTECWCVGVRDAGVLGDGSAWIKYSFGELKFVIALRIDASVIKAHTDHLARYASELAAFTIGEPGINLANSEIVDGTYWFRVDR